MPVTDAMLQNPEPADWLAWLITLDHSGYKPVELIDRRNFDTLQLVWTRPLGFRIQEETRHVFGAVLYFQNPSDLRQAFDTATGNFP